jgi:hypothetical protein
MGERLETEKNAGEKWFTRSRAQRGLVALLLTLGGLAFALHFLHLRADFPNNSPWNDWAKYTDEGWYGDAAIRYYLRGTWRLPGDFNPAVALPVWPLLEAALFRFTGVGILAARALTVCVFGCVLCSSFFFLRLHANRSDDQPLRTVFAAAAVLVLAVSPFVYAFTRMAILEPLLVLMMLLSLQAAYAARLAQFRWQRAAYAAGVGLLIALMIGTKTTAMFLLPAIAYMLADSCGWRLRRTLRTAMVTGAAVFVLCGGYYLLLVHRGYLGDFRYLFTANAYTGITQSTFLQTVGDALADGMWIGTLLYPLAGLMLIIACVRVRIWRDPVFTSLALWAAGYMVFMTYHANLQPRYYLVVAVPLILLLLRGALHVAEWHPVAPLALAPLLLLVVGHEARMTLNFARHPDYTYQTAAVHIERIVEAEPSHSHTVLSISGSNLSLMTGIPSICDDFGTMDLEDRIAAYRPGWFVSWNYVEDDKMAVLSRFYTLTRVAEFPALDDPERNLMIVYRLDPKEGIKPKRRRPGARLLPMALEHL